MLSKFIASTKVDLKDVPAIPQVGAETVLNSVLNTAYFMAALVAVVVIVVAGILYTTSNGDPAKTKRAREAILYAGVGIVVIMMAFLITSYIIGRF